MIRIEMGDDHWYPQGTRLVYEPPTVGSLVAWQHAVWHVVETTPVPETKWTDKQRQEVATTTAKYRHKVIPTMVVLRPVHIVSEDPRARDHDVHLQHSGYVSWHAYPDEHYPICSSCHEPLPCREKFSERVAADVMKRMARFETPGVCPACGEAVTHRQKSYTFQQNAHVLTGPPVTFHVGRRGCRYSAADYERKLLEQDPTHRRVFSCTGHVTNHNDGTYDCTALADCPGPQADHPSYSVCRCPDCHARGDFGCHPSDSARRNGAGTNGLF